MAISLSMPIYLAAQTDDLDKLMTRRQIDCRDIVYNCWFLIPEYYQKERLDSVQILMDYWEHKCGMNEELYRAKFLFSILNRTFDDKKLDTNIFNDILQRNANKVYANSARHYYRPRFEYKMDTIFDNFITRLGRRVLNQNLTKTEAFLVKSYVDTVPTQLSELDNKMYNNTNIQRLYFQYKDRRFKKPNVHIGLYGGYFNLTGNNKILGDKGILGAYMGYQFNKNQIDLIGDVKFGRVQETYYVVNKGKLVGTNECSGLYLGLEYSRVLVKKPLFDLLFLAGAGGERITSIYEDKTNNITPKFFWSPTFNGGLGFRRYYNTNKLDFENIPYWGLQMRFNYLNFVNTGGTDISGDAFSFRFILGL
jgi:hypothetical protein